MIIVTGDGRIVKDLDKDGVLRELREAQKRGDKYCSVTGAYALGLDPVALAKEAGYKVGATEKQTIASLDKSARQYLSSIGKKGGEAGRGEAKKRGDSDYYKKMRAAREAKKTEQKANR